VYFSFVTLTTVGYGDLTAAFDAGRIASIFEALFGQLYLVSVVALLVANLGRERRVRD
jgi:voltage-gated potassium channel Kch